MALDEADLGGRMRKSSHDKRVRFGPVTHRIIPARQRGNGTPPARTLRVVESDSEDEDLETLACMGLMCPPEPSEVFGLETLASVSDCADDLLGDPSNTGKVDVAAEAFYTHDADGDLPISLEALETITCWEAEDAARDEESEATKAAEAKAVAMLPRTFDMLQSIFGLHGPCAMPRDKVVSKLKTTCSARTPVSHEEVDAMLVALADAAPRYLRLLSAEETSNHVPMVRISRHVEIMGLKKDLRTRADAAASLR